MTRFRWVEFMSWRMSGRSIYVHQRVWSTLTRMRFAVTTMLTSSSPGAKKLLGTASISPSFYRGLSADFVPEKLRSLSQT